MDATPNRTVAPKPSSPNLWASSRSTDAPTTPSATPAGAPAQSNGRRPGRPGAQLPKAKATPRPVDVPNLATRRRVEPTAKPSFRYSKQKAGAGKQIIGAAVTFNGVTYHTWVTKDPAHPERLLTVTPRRDDIYFDCTKYKPNAESAPAPVPAAKPVPVVRKPHTRWG